MKKLFAALIMFIILINGLPEQNNFSLKNYFDGKYSAYTSEPVGDNHIDLGFCYMGTTYDKESVVGESIVVANFEPISALKILNAKLVKTEFLDDGTSVLYAYSNLIANSVDVDNNKVNLQIAHKEDYSVIGWPLILGSF